MRARQMMMAAAGRRRAVVTDQVPNNPATSINESARPEFWNGLMYAYGPTFQTEIVSGTVMTLGYRPSYHDGLDAVIESTPYGPLTRFRGSGSGNSGESFNITKPFSFEDQDWTIHCYLTPLLLQGSLGRILSVGVYSDYFAPLYFDGGIKFDSGHTYKIATYVESATLGQYYSLTTRYANGVVDGFVNDAQAFSLTDTIATPSGTYLDTLSLGGPATTSNARRNYFNGVVATAQIWDRALSDTEIQQLAAFDAIDPFAIYRRA